MVKSRGHSEVFALIILVLLSISIWQRNQILDWIKLRDYTPPAEIAKLAREDTMTSKAAHLYYVNHAQLISDTAQFNKVCSQQEQTIVLGCYLSGENGIYLRSVSDSRLAGIEEVTAAHEMLHGVYDRLGTRERQDVDAMLMDYYDNHLTDQRIKDVINAYKKTEPNAVVDEMHSVFGTEVADLPAPLEDYYKQYFSDRHAVTDFAASYEAEFTSREDQIKADEAELNQLKKQIDSEEASLSAQSQQLTQQRNQLNQIRDGGNSQEYNNLANAYNNSVDVYNAGVAKLQNDISKYNALVDAHNEVAAELSGLYSSLGTSLSPQATQ